MKLKVCYMQNLVVLRGWAFQNLSIRLLETEERNSSWFCVADFKKNSSSSEAATTQWWKRQYRDNFNNYSHLDWKRMGVTQQSLVWSNSKAPWLHIGSLLDVPSLASVLLPGSISIINYLSWFLALLFGIICFPYSPWPAVLWTYVVYTLQGSWLSFLDKWCLGAWVWF